MADFRNLASSLDKVNTQEVAHIFPRYQPNIELRGRNVVFYVQTSTAEYADVAVAGIGPVSTCHRPIEMVRR